MSQDVRLSVLKPGKLWANQDNLVTLNFGSLDFGKCDLKRQPTLWPWDGREGPS